MVGTRKGTRSVLVPPVPSRTLYLRHKTAQLGTREQHFLYSTNYEYLYKYTVFPVREYAHIYARKEILVLLCHLFVKEGVIKND